jgi:DHA2 family multidrug resistance protein-like MFS transporter
MTTTRRGLHTATTTAGSGPSPATAGRREWLALAVLMFPVLLVSVDNTVLGFALPSIAEALNPTAGQQLWIIDVYPLMLAGLLVAMGSMGDRFGRRKLLLIGATGFATVSAIAAYAPTAAALITARAALGFFGAMLMPSTLSLLRNIFRDDAQRRLAIAIWAAFFSAGAALGPILGGFLLERFWWGSVFLLAVPMLIPLLALAPVYVPESKDPNPGRPDPISIGLSLLALAPIVYAVKSLAEGADLLGTGLPLVIGIAASAAFVRRQLTQEQPMLDMHLFRNRAFSGAVIVNLLLVFSLVGFLFFVSQHLQLVIGQSPMQAGLALIPGLILMVLSGLAAVKLVRRLSPAVVICAGLLIATGGYVLVAATTGPESVWPLIAAFALLGLGLGAAETLSNDLIVASVPADRAGAASAVSETSYELGAVLGTAVLGAVLAATYRLNLVVPAGVSPAQAHDAAETLAGAHRVAAELPAPVAESLLHAAGRAFDAGVSITSAIGVIVMLAAARLAWRTLR